MLDQLGHGQLVRKLEHDFVSARSFWALAQSRGRGTSHDHQTGFPSTMSLEEVDAAGCSAILDGGLERASDEGQATHWIPVKMRLLFCASSG